LDGREVGDHYFGAIHFQGERVVFAFDMTGPAIEPIPGGGYRFEQGFISFAEGCGSWVSLGSSPIKLDGACPFFADDNGQPEFAASTSSSWCRSDQCQHQT